MTNMIRAREVEQYTVVVHPDTGQVVDVLSVRADNNGDLTIDTVQNVDFVVKPSDLVELAGSDTPARPHGCLAILLVYLVAALLVAAVLISSS